MKKTISLLLIVVCLALSLVGCTDDKTKSKSNDQNGNPPAGFTGKIYG